jgi:hypothetical protein
LKREKEKEKEKEKEWLWPPWGWLATPIFAKGVAQTG